MGNSEVINSMVNDILAGRNNDAAEKFNQALSLKVADAIETKKVELAQSIYAGNTETE